MTSACTICRRLDDLRAGRGEPPVAELTETFAVLADQQGSPGWCVLLLKDHADHLADLPPDRQRRVFDDLIRTAAAVRRAFPTSGIAGGPPRINYECLGNLVPHVHWHVIPRHADDPDPTRPIWLWPPDRQRGSMPPAERAGLIQRLRAAINAAINDP